MPYCNKNIGLYYVLHEVLLKYNAADQTIIRMEWVTLFFGTPPTDSQSWRRPVNVELYARCWQSFRYADTQSLEIFSSYIKKPSYVILTKLQGKHICFLLWSSLISLVLLICILICTLCQTVNSHFQGQC